MRQTLLLVALLLLPAGSAFGQWTFAGAFPADSSMQRAIQGIAVLPNTNVVIAPFSSLSEGLYIYSADGEPVDTIRTVTSAAGEVSLAGASPRGLATAPDGTLILGFGSSLYHIDPSDWSLVNEVSPQGRPVAGPAVDAQGRIYAPLVIQGEGPIRLYNPDFSFAENVVDTSRSFIRSIAVTESGDAVYVGAYSEGAIWKYSRPDEFSPFGAADTLLRGYRSEALARNPGTGHIWFGNGLTASGAPEAGTPLTWYGIDPATDEIVDSLKLNTGGVDPAALMDKPRAVAFSVTGDTAYVGLFDVTLPASVQMFVRGEIVQPAVERTDELPTTFSLEGNYPNPFNPTTNIRFSLTAATHATLKVYDTLGREVAVLVDEPLTPGVYHAPFEGTGLASGTYLYVLEAAGQRESRTMVLLK